MTSARLKLIDDIFREALSLEDDQREPYVRELCGSDNELYQEVWALVQASGSSDEAVSEQFERIRGQLWQSLSSQQDDEEDLSSQRIDSWLLIERIARGGLSTVYLAHRDDGIFDQIAAFKVLRRGLDTDDVVSRFRAERQILSNLEHPAIAKIYDGGAMADGRPYLVLEYIDGLRITDYCKQKQVSVRARIGLLIDILLALEHAHKRLVVHRDIKPSNILVSHDGNPVLLDFGISKLLDGNAHSGASTDTRTGVTPLTPGYSSPEQLRGETVTTASDIYQTGLLMYELLCGQRPVPEKPKDHTLEPLPPSRVLRGKPSYSTVRGDLDVITLKAMQADPLSRYGSANEMIADLQNWLEGRPVKARSNSWGYRLSKLHKRKPWLIATLLVGALMIVGYVVTLTLHNQQLKLEQQRTAAALDFLVDVMQSPDPFVPGDPASGKDISMVRALEVGVQRLQGSQYSDPKLRATLLVPISDVHASLGQFQQAIELREEALGYQKEIDGLESVQVLMSYRMLASQYLNLNQYDKAGEFYAEQLRLAQILYPQGHPAIGEAEAAMGGYLSGQGKLDEGTALLSAAIGKMQLSADQYARSLIGAVLALTGYRGTDSLDDTLNLLAQAQTLADKHFGESSLQAAMIRTQKATSYSYAYDVQRAEENFLAAISIYEDKLGRSHNATMTAINNLAILYGRKGELEKSEALHREYLEYTINNFGMEHRGTANALQNLASGLALQQRYEEAIPLHYQAFEAYRSVLKDDNFGVAIPLISIAYAHVKLTQFDQALPMAQQALDWFDRTAPGTLFQGISQCLVGAALNGQGEAENARQWKEKSRLILNDINTPKHYASLCLGTD